MLWMEQRVKVDVNSEIRHVRVVMGLDLQRKLFITPPDLIGPKFELKLSVKSC